MKKRFLASILILFSTQAIFSQEKILTMGEDEQWQGVTTANIRRDVGKKGFDNLQLSDKEYLPDRDTDLLLHFNSERLNVDNSYEIISKGSIDRLNYSLGGGAVSFSEANSSVVLLPREGSIFAPGTVVGDFSMEFRLRPNDLSRRENVFYWKNVRIVNDELSHQYISCSIKNRMIQWDFINFFTPKDLSELLVSLKSRSRLIPGEWSHHLITFNSRSGKLIYRINGSVEDVQFVTENGTEFDTVLIPKIGDNQEGLLHLGKIFSGKMDELRITRSIVKDSFQQRFSGKKGVVLSAPIDLHFTNTHLVKINSKRSEPGNSSIFYYYRSSNDRTDKLHWAEETVEGYLDKAFNSSWIPFLPDKPLNGNTNARYLQIAAELYPDGEKAVSPVLKNLSVVYLEDLPPIPPSGLFASAKDGSVLLNWKPVTDTDLSGYMVYYGEASGFYFGEQGAMLSPVDVGNVTHFKIDKLKNGKLYFFSIVAYDNSYNPEEKKNGPHKSGFSNEVSARPSRIYGVGE